MKRVAADDLVILVTLAGYQNQISDVRLRYRLMNRVRAIGNLSVRPAGLANSLLRVAKDLLGILGARIIGSENDNVAQTSRRLAHWRALGSIAITAATKDSDDLAFDDFACSLQQIQQRIISVRVI